jgi:ClpP class serine protease
VNFRYLRVSLNVISSSLSGRSSDDLRTEPRRLRRLASRSRRSIRSCQHEAREQGKIHANEVLKTRQRIDELYAKHTGQSEQRVRADMERDRFFTPEQAREYGLIDRVIYHH